MKKVDIKVINPNGPKRPRKLGRRKVAQKKPELGANIKEDKESSKSSNPASEARVAREASIRVSQEPGIDPEYAKLTQELASAHIRAVRGDFAKHLSYLISIHVGSRLRTSSGKLSPEKSFEKMQNWSLKAKEAWSRNGLDIKEDLSDHQSILRFFEKMKKAASQDGFDKKEASMDLSNFLNEEEFFIQDNVALITGTEKLTEFIQKRDISDIPKIRTSQMKRYFYNKSKSETASQSTSASSFRFFLGKPQEAIEAFADAFLDIFSVKSMGRFLDPEANRRPNPYGDNRFLGLFGSCILREPLNEDGGGVHQLPHPSALENFAQRSRTNLKQRILANIEQQKGLQRYQLPHYQIVRGNSARQFYTELGELMLKHKHLKKTDLTPSSEIKGNELHKKGIQSLLAKAKKAPLKKSKDYTAFVNDLVGLLKTYSVIEPRVEFLFKKTAKATMADLNETLIHFGKNSKNPPKSYTRAVEKVCDEFLNAVFKDPKDAISSLLEAVEESFKKSF